MAMLSAVVKSLHLRCSMASPEQICSNSFIDHSVIVLVSLFTIANTTPLIQRNISRGLGRSWQSRHRCQFRLRLCRYYRKEEWCEYTCTGCAWLRLWLKLWLWLYGSQGFFTFSVSKFHTFPNKNFSDFSVHFFRLYDSWVLNAFAKDSRKSRTQIQTLEAELEAVQWFN